MVRGGYSSWILILEDVRAAPDGQQRILVSEEVSHVELFDGFFEFEREVDFRVGFGDKGGMRFPFGEVLLVGAGLATGRAFGLGPLILMQKLQLFECLHDGLELGRTTWTALLHAFAGGLTRD